MLCAFGAGRLLVHAHGPRNVGGRTSEDPNVTGEMRYESCKPTPET